MSRHPSLSAPKLVMSHVQLSPVPKMGRNELCWCRSSRKYKNCHLIRESLSVSNVFDQELQMFAELREGYCSASDAFESNECSSKIAKAHTVQKKGGLVAISEDDHVLTVKPLMKEMITSRGAPDPRRIGLNKASVFPGFCTKHDSEIFKPIEAKTVKVDSETAFLLAYRAAAYERFSKEAEGRINSIMRDTADRGRSFPVQAAIQSHLYNVSIGIELGKRDVNRAKQSYDQLLRAKSRENFRYLAVRFDRVLPIVACCAFYPEFDMSGKRLQQLGQDRVELDHITLTVTSFDETTFAFFGWIGPREGPARSLVDSFVQIEDSRKADALSRLLFIQSDNIFLNQKWWEGLPSDHRIRLKDMTRSGTTVRIRTAQEYRSDFELVSAEAVEVFSNL
jgi:hypothetical protein